MNSTAKAMTDAIEEAIDELEKVRNARAKCNGWKHLADVFEAAGKFVEDGVDELISYLEEIRSYAQEIIEENERLKERLEALDIPEERTA